MDPVNENFTRLFNRAKHMNEQGDHTRSNRADMESAPTKGWVVYFQPVVL